MRLAPVTNTSLFAAHCFIGIVGAAPAKSKPPSAAPNVRPPSVVRKIRDAPATIQFAPGSLEENAPSARPWVNACQDRPPVPSAAAPSKVPPNTIFGSDGCSAPARKRTTLNPPFRYCHGPLPEMLLNSP